MYPSAIVTHVSQSASNNIVRIVNWTTPSDQVGSPHVWWISNFKEVKETNMIDAYLHARINARCLQSHCCYDRYLAFAFISRYRRSLYDNDKLKLIRNERLEFAAFAKGPQFRESRSRSIVQYTNKRNIHQVFIEFVKRGEKKAEREERIRIGWGSLLPNYVRLQEECKKLRRKRKKPQAHRHHVKWTELV